jgi:hypothetical protein
MLAKQIPNYEYAHSSPSSIVFFFLPLRRRYPLRLKRSKLDVCVGFATNNAPDVAPFHCRQIMKPGAFPGIQLVAQRNGSAQWLKPEFKGHHLFVRLTLHNPNSKSVGAAERCRTDGRIPRVQ